MPVQAGIGVRVVFNFTPLFQVPLSPQGPSIGEGASWPTYHSRLNPPIPAHVK